jgi:hypothetical protein
MGPEDPYADASAAPSPLVELVAEASQGVSPEDISADACAAFSPCAGLLTEAASGMGPEDPERSVTVAPLLRGQGSVHGGVLISGLVIVTLLTTMLGSSALGWKLILTRFFVVQ